MVRRKAASTTTTEGDANMANMTAAQTEALQTLYSAIGAALGITSDAAPADDAPAAKTPAKKAPAAKTTAEPVPTDPAADRKAELSKKTVVALRKIAVEIGFDADDVKAVKDKDELIDAIIEGEAEAAAEADEDADDEAVEDDADETDDDADDDADDEDADDDEPADDDDDSGDDDTRESLSGMPLRALRKHVIDNYDVDDDEINKMSKTDIVDWLFSEADDDDDAADDEDQDDADEEDGDDDDDALTEEDLQEMSIAQLKTTVKEYGGKVPTGTVTKKALIKLIGDLADVEF